MQRCSCYGHNALHRGWHRRRRYCPRTPAGCFGNAGCQRRTSYRTRTECTTAGSHRCRCSYGRRAVPPQRTRCWAPRSRPSGPQSVPSSHTCSVATYFPWTSSTAKRALGTRHAGRHVCDQSDSGALNNVLVHTVFGRLQPQSETLRDFAFSVLDPLSSIPYIIIAIPKLLRLRQLSCLHTPHLLSSNTQRTLQLRMQFECLYCATVQMAYRAIK